MFGSVELCDDLQREGVGEFAPLLHHTVVVAPRAAQLSEGLPERGRREAPDARAEPGQEEHVDEEGTQLCSEAVWSGRRGEKRVSHLQEVLQDGVPGVSGDGNVWFPNECKRDGQHLLTQPVVLITVGQVSERARHKQLTELLKDDLTVEGRVLVDRLRGGLLGSVEGAQPAIVHVDAQLYQCLLRQRESQAVAKHL